MPTFLFAASPALELSLPAALRKSPQRASQGPRAKSPRRWPGQRHNERGNPRTKMAGVGWPLGRALLPSYLEEAS